MKLIKAAALFALICLFAAPGYAQKTIKTYATSKTVIAKGEALFQKNCAECHNFRQRGIGPSLTGVTADAPYTYLSKFIINSQALVKSGDKRAKQIFAEYKVPMPAHTKFTGADINALLSYIHVQKPVADAPVNVADLGEKIKDPIPTKIGQAGLTLKLEEFATAPATSTKGVATRINQTFVLKQGNVNRLLILDMRGKLYEIKNKQFNVLMDITKYKPNFMNDPGLGTGWGTFALHPEFNKNGLMYTTHAEKKGSAPADFAYADSLPVAVQWIVTEWKIKDPMAATFEAEPREMYRVNMPNLMHGMQQLTFNPLAQLGSPDYGLLYQGIGDGGSSEMGYRWLCDDPTQIRGAVLRVDPAGRNSKNGKYGLPAINPWASDKDPNTLGELFAIGFRNPNKITWTPDGKMLITDIGYTNLEEINIGKPGLNYGWPEREGTFLLTLGKNTGLYNLPANEAPKYTYPVAMYDHDEGNAIAGGFVYTGSIAALKGKYIFGDVVKGRVFYVKNADLAIGKQAVIKEFDLDFAGTKSTFVDMVKNKKADFRMGLGVDNVLYLFCKTDGKMWEVKDCVAN